MREVPALLISRNIARERVAALASALEELDRALVLFGGRERLESAQVPAPAGLAVLLSGVEPVLPRFELTDHQESYAES